MTYSKGNERWRDPHPASDAEIIALLAKNPSPVVRRVLEAEAKKRGLDVPGNGGLTPFTPVV